MLQETCLPDRTGKETQNRSAKLRDVLSQASPVLSVGDSCSLEVEWGMIGQKCSYMGKRTRELPDADDGPERLWR